MRVAALYDIHGNLPALEAVLKEVRGAAVEQIVVGGDVFPGPMPNETLAYLLGPDIPVRFLCGNGDREVRALAEGKTLMGSQNSTEPRCIGWRSDFIQSIVGR